MKKLCTSFFMLSALYSFGQFKQIGLNTGLIAGKAILDRKVPDYIGNDNKVYTGFHFSAYSDYYIGKHVLVSPEIAYCIKGSRLRWDYTPTRGNSYTVRIKFIETPLMLKLLLSDNKIKGFIECGPSFMVGLRSYEKLEVWYLEGKNSKNKTLYIKNTPMTNPDFAFNFGFGFIKETKEVNWGLGFRYQFSFNNSTYIFHSIEPYTSVTRYASKNGSALFYFKIALKTNQKNLTSISSTIK
jgi:hypothetical protein